MEIKKTKMSSFSVIGRQGSTEEGPDMVKNLWEAANTHFEEIVHLAVKNEAGKPAAIWGLMSDVTLSFQPWKDFREGYYLAGAQVPEEAQAPEGWTKWTAPQAEYLYVKVEMDPGACIENVMEYMQANDMELAGAVFDYFCPEEDGQFYMFFPVREVKD